MTVTLYNVRDFVASPANFPNAYIQGSGKFFMLLRDISVQLTTGHTITIPMGYKWDMSSSPRVLWGWYPPYGDFLFAALIHDYLYVKKSFGITRAEADREMLIWSNMVCTDHTDNIIRYWAVKRFGQKWWDGKVKYIKQ